MHSCIEILRNEASIEDASRLWGKDVWQIEKTIKKGKKGLTSVVSIGPDGERLVGFSIVVNHLDRVAARGGPGAVMGSKKLKAIIVEGSGRVPLAGEDSLRLTPQ